MRPMTPGPRKEPPLTGHRPKPQGGVEPPLTASRMQGQKTGGPRAAAVPPAVTRTAAPHSDPGLQRPATAQPRPAEARSAADADFWLSAWQDQATVPVAEARGDAPVVSVTPRRVVAEGAARPRPAPVARAEAMDDGAMHPSSGWAKAAAATLFRPAFRPRRHVQPPRDPAPSRLSYRMHRLWLTPIYRSLFRVGMPGFAAAFAVGLYLSDDGRRAALAETGAGMVRSIQERPEFMVNLMAIEGASPELAEAIRLVLPVDFPVSSFDLDLETMRATVAELDAVAAADLRIRPGGILEVAIDERVPAIIWRAPDGLMLLDATGRRVGPIDSRLDRPDLPVIAGDGADQAVPEALKLIDAAAPVAPRLRGLVRMGERRWDVVLDRGQRILLPESGALTALERVMALAEADEMLDRDVTVIDMRYGARPTLRLSPQALEALRGQAVETGATNG